MPRAPPVTMATLPSSLQGRNRIGQQQNNEASGEEI
jgi:hypothetical protein